MSIIASNSVSAGAEDSPSIELVLSAQVSGTALDGFRITALPSNGTVYLDAALTIPAVAGSLIADRDGTLSLYFKPDANFNGTVDLKYVAVGHTSGGGVLGAADFYLSVDGIDGGGVVRGYEGAFSVADFSFDVSNIVPMSGGGGGAGKATVSPLVVDLPPGANLNGFLEAAATGRHIAHVQLEGATSGALGRPETVYDLRLENVLVTKVTDSNGVDHLEFNYEKVTLTTTEQDASGRLGTPETFGFDVAQNIALTTPLPPATPGAGGTVESAEGTVTIDVTPVNDEPVLAAALPAVQILEDSFVDFTIPAGTFTAADGDVLTFSARTAGGATCRRGYSSIPWGDACLVLRPRTSMVSST